MLSFGAPSAARPLTCLTELASAVGDSDACGFESFAIPSPASTDDVEVGADGARAACACVLLDPAAFLDMSAPP